MQTNGWKEKLHEIIFEADTRAGKTFDILLLICIAVSIVVVCLESVESINLRYGSELRTAEVFLTLLFTLEYILRIITVRKPSAYIFSFFGIIDLLSILPSYIGFFFSGTQSLMVVRSIRLLRVFRILKLTHFVGEATVLAHAISNSKNKIIVFLFTMSSLVLILGASMYVVEGGANGFTSIPQGVYWAIVTVTTVGYGDIAPQTVLGKTISSMMMLMGYGILAIPTGIVTAEMKSFKIPQNTENCPRCLSSAHDDDANYCKYCGEKLKALQNE